VTASATKPPPHVLSARPETWRLSDAAAGVPDAVREAVLRRDGWTCRYCGFRDARYQELLHLDGDHANHAEGNLACVCGLCHAPFHPGHAGLGGEGSLVWLPEITQAQCSHLARALQVVFEFGNPHAGTYDAAKGPPPGLAGTYDAAMALHDALAGRQREAERRVGTADPAVLGVALLGLAPDAYARRARALDGVRFFGDGRRADPTGRDVFREMVRFWASPEGPFAAFPPARWGAVLRAFAADVKARKAAKPTT